MVLKSVIDWLKTNVDVIGAVIRVGVIILILLSLQSCGAQWHLRRAIAKDPSIARDTVVRVDTSIVTDERRVVDTLVVRDTIVREIVRDNVRIRVQRFVDTLVVDATCLPDTVELVVETPVDRLIIKKEKPRLSFLDKLAWVLMLAIALCIIVMLLRTFR